MTITTILNKSTILLRESNNPVPRLDAELLLAYLLDVDRSYFILQGDRDIEQEMIAKYTELIDRRLLGEPIAYIIGHQEFMGFNFIVNNNVLIPRPDTETLVEYAINYCKSNIVHDLLDIGTGSGAIALSIGKNIPDCVLTLVDISEDALKVAKKNAKILGITNKVNYLVSDCFSEIKSHKFSMILSNPPYIPTLDIEGLQTEVRTYEPRGALDGGNDGLMFYRRIIQEARNYLVEHGLIAFEIGYNQASEVEELLAANGYENVHVIKDLGGNDRVVVGKLSIV